MLMVVNENDMKEDRSRGRTREVGNRVRDAPATLDATRALGGLGRSRVIGVGNVKRHPDTLRPQRADVLEL